MSEDFIKNLNKEINGIIAKEVDSRARIVAASLLDFIEVQKDCDPVKTLDFMRRYLTAILNGDDYLEMPEDWKKDFPDVPGIPLR